MAKGRDRPKKEKKKPKQNKPKKGPAVSSSAQMTELFHKVDDDNANRKGKK